MKWVLYVVGGLVGLVALVWLIGALLPREHVATRSARYLQPHEAIWKVITDAEAMPQWRTGLTAVKRLPEENGLPGWVETASFGEIPLRVEQMDPPQRLVLRIASDELPFGGTWTYEIAAVEGGATLRITENGLVKNAFFRFMSRFLFGHTATIEQYLKDLGKKFGEEVTPQP
jgi:uncharacterized protein YndB with AHSA1/START domain